MKYINVYEMPLYYQLPLYKEIGVTIFDTIKKAIEGAGSFAKYIVSIEWDGEKIISKIVHKY